MQYFEHFCQNENGRCILRINTTVNSLILICFILFLFSPATGKENLKYVNPFIGTAPATQPSNWDGHGRTFPGAVAPFGVLQLTPETRISSGKGYDYRDSVIYFFSCLGHQSGYPNGSAGKIKIMPVENFSTFELSNDFRPFSHSNEKAEPGYYKVKFNDNGTTLEATTSIRSGMFRLVFKENTNPKIFIGDLGSIQMEAGTTVKGSFRNTWIEFDTAWKSAEKSGYGYIFTFDKTENNTLLIKLSTSSVSSRNSKINLDAEIPGWNFDTLKKKTQNDWEKELSVIEIHDSSVPDKTKFYTALYHSLIIPWIISDVDGTYLGRDAKIYQAKGDNQYGTFSPWDTFRTLHPLLCIIAPNRQNDMIISMLDIYRQTGQLPVEPMTGFHSIPIIVDSYLKGISGFDKMLAYEAMKNLLLSDEKKKPDLESYIHNGFVSSDYPESVTRTVEYAYNDWVLSQFAREVMNQFDDHSLLLKRSLNYQNLFDPNQLFLVPRGENGFILSEDNFGFKEGDKWNYSLFVPHNIRDIINFKGGNQEFASHLDSAIFNVHILFDNEPNFHIPYLFNYSKSPFKTQEWVSKIRETYFTTDAGGLPGNDDLGSMSSWFVFNAMGFLPVCPGVPEYNIGTPLFEKVIIHNPNGNDFIINGIKTSSEDKYIQSASLNGKDFNQTWFNHAEISNGGEIIFYLGSNPSEWAVNSTSEAFSVTKTEAEISVDSVWLPKTNVDPNEIFKVFFSLKNTGSSGVKIVRLFDDQKEVALKNVYVEKGRTVVDSMFFRLYKPGFTNLIFEGSDKKITVNVNKSDVHSFEISLLSFIPILKVNETQHFRFSVKNSGGTFDSTLIKIYINNKLFKSENIAVEPGETVSLEYKTSDCKTGINLLQVDSLTGVFKVYNENINATLADIRVHQIYYGIIKDISGFSNHGIVKTIDSKNQDFDSFNVNSFVEIKNSLAFSSLENEITMMGWVNLTVTENYPVSIITQGDHNVIQLLNKNEIEFFAGGWGRGTCNANLSSGFLDGWHHIAGVADGLLLKLYIDGKLMETVTLDNNASLITKANWNLGRNEEFPGKRIFNGKMDGVKIFAVALLPNEIAEIVDKEKSKFD